MKKNHKPSRELLLCTSLYVKAMAYTKAIRPRIEGLQKGVLEKHAYINRYSGEVITDPNLAFAMSDDDSARYYTELHAVYIENGFEVEFGKYPLAIAENLERQARDAMIKLSVELQTGIKIEDLYTNMKWLNKYTELLLQLLVPQLDATLLTIP